jgi:O-glycosyl hydrolase
MAVCSRDLAVLGVAAALAGCGSGRNFLATLAAQSVTTFIGTP